MKPVHCVATLLTVALLSGCGASRINAGQLDYDNGVAYKHGSTDPFTGEVHFGEDDQSPFTTVLVELTRNEWIPQSPNLSPRISLSYSCLSSFKNGVPDGFTQCDQGHGKAEFSFTLRDGRLDGEGVVYNTKGDKVFVTHWKNGAYDGTQKVYSLDGNNVVHEWSVEDGHKRGKEYWAYNNGDDLAEGKWSDDGKFSGTMFFPDERTVYTLKDGVKDGDFKKFDYQDPNLKKVAVEGSYSNGRRDGTWTYHGQVPRDEFLEASRSAGFPQLLAIPQEATTTVTWKQGALSGPVKIVDKDQHVLLAFTMVDGEIAAPIVRTDPESGKRFTLSDDATIRAMNAANVRGSSMSDPSCLGPMLRQQTPGGVTYIFNYYCNVDYSRTHLSDLQSATINHLLDPVKFPDAPSDAAISKAEADAQAVSTPSHGNASQEPSPITGLNFCVDDWLRSSYKGGDVIATQDQIDQWTKSCDQGKHPSN